MKEPRDSLSLSRAGAADGRHRCIGMQSFALQWIPFHSIADVFHRNGMDTIGMDTYPFIAGAADAGGHGK